MRTLRASHATLHGLFWLTANLAELGPLLLAVDDVHWCDPPSQRFLSYLARRLEGLPVAVAACARTREPGVDAAVLDALESEPLATVVRPAPLSPDAVAQLLRERLESDPAEEFVQTVHASCAGNPFLLNELVHAILAEQIEPTAGRGRTRPRTRARVAFPFRPAAASPPRPGGRGPSTGRCDPGRGARPGAHAPLVALGKSLYLVGGTNAAGRPLDQILRIDPVSGSATPAGLLPSPLANAAATTVRGRIVVLGGEGKAASDAVLVLQPAHRKSG